MWEKNNDQLKNQKSDILLYFITKNQNNIYKDKNTYFN